MAGGGESEVWASLPQECGVVACRGHYHIPQGLKDKELIGMKARRCDTHQYRTKDINASMLPSG